MAAKTRFQRLLSFSVSITNFIVSNKLSHTFKKHGKNNRTGLLIECDQKSEIKYAAFPGQIVSIRKEYYAINNYSIIFLGSLTLFYQVSKEKNHFNVV